MAVFEVDLQLIEYVYMKWELLQSYIFYKISSCPKPQNCVSPQQTLLFTCHDLGHSSFKQSFQHRITAAFFLCYNMCFCKTLITLGRQVAVIIASKLQVTF